ncbi:DUF342 domain-containing protein [Salicibibacter cibarius]|uniref:DUF342 domain-containing protein n=1 Tax=Salicibibacter cibarius TaxID=2743000 RepID=A0A7T6Z3S2_9BACI|nr:FapA family protein [Salicibibacter cibarius]QQK76359.1 DUF342 domain-containing protein [Salicibibacter cibarius]
MELSKYFKIKVSRDAMMASCFSNKPVKDGDFHEEDVLKFLHANGIVYGIDDESIGKLANDPIHVTFPLIMAKGKKPTRGTDAYLETTRKHSSSREENGDSGSVDLRQVTEIPMATQNEIVARKVDPTTGESGVDVYGNTIPGLRGKDFPLRPGKNTALSEDGKSLQAILNGQLSIAGRTVHVYPVYEVPGNLTMKTGSITFNGNVVIHGSIPSGYRVNADGDIHVKGSVDAAYLEAGGSVFVSQGIAGQGKGEINARYDVHSGYINQGVVFAGHNIHVSNHILHSQCEAGHALICTSGKGNVVGGKLSAGRTIKVKEAGNTLNTRTSLYIGVQEKLLTARKEAESVLLNGKKEKAKLQTLQTKMAEKGKENPPLSTKDRIMKLRIRQSLSELYDRMRDARDTLQAINDRIDGHGYDGVFISHQVFVNTNVHIGKYKRRITKNRSAVKIFLSEGEIRIAEQDS